MSSKYWILPVPAREKFHRQPFSVTGLTFRLNVFFPFFYAFNDKTLQLTTSCNTQIKQKWHLALSLQKLVEIFRRWSSTVSPQTKWLAQDESVPFVIIWKPSREKNHRFISFTNGTIAYIIKEHGNGVKKMNDKAIFYSFQKKRGKRIHCNGIPNMKMFRIKKWSTVCKPVSFGYFVSMSMSFCLLVSLT